MAISRHRELGSWTNAELTRLVTDPNDEGVSCLAAITLDTLPAGTIWRVTVSRTWRWHAPSGAVYGVGHTIERPEYHHSLTDALARFNSLADDMAGDEAGWRDAPAGARDRLAERIAEAKAGDQADQAALAAQEVAA